MQDILKLADECLNCKVPRCKTGCPINTNIPEFIKEVKDRNLEKAYNILQENNILSKICARVCPVENQCMGKCIKGIKGKPVQINTLEAFVNNWAEKNNIFYKIPEGTNNKKKVAVIGTGPAGISCAVELRKLGYDITMYEKEKYPRRIAYIWNTRFSFRKEVSKRYIY